MANSLKNKFKYSALAALIVTLLSCTVMAFTGFGFGAPAETANADTGISAQSNTELAAAWNSAVQESIDGNGKQVTFTLTENWTAASHATYGTSLGEGVGFYMGVLNIPCDDEYANIVLDLNGYTIDLARSSAHRTGYVVFVSGSLTLEDSSAGKTGKIIGGNKGGITVGDFGTFVMRGGTIAGNMGYGVEVYDGSFAMYGGTISGNSTANNGGGVRIEDSSTATFDMYGGEISGNIASGFGGGVYVGAYSRFEMTGGTITGNTATKGGDEVAFCIYDKADWNYAVAFSLAHPEYEIYCVWDRNWTADSSTHFFGTGTGFSNGRIYVPQGANIVLDLNGYTIDRGLTSAIDDGSVFYVNGTLTLTDTSASKAGKIMGGFNNNGGGVNIESGGTFTMNGGTISYNTAKYNGGGVRVYSGGSFNMYGGVITGNTVEEDDGGGVMVSRDGYFYMYGGEISGNTASRSGGGVEIATRGHFEMYGGEISGNTASSRHGGGVDADSGGSFNMYGGEISGNTAVNGGGLYSNINFYIEGGAKIVKNEAENGGGVYCAGGSSMIDGGIVSENKSTGSGEGSGVYVSSSASFDFSGGSISNNIGGWGGIVTYGKFDMYGGVIEGHDIGVVVLSGSTNPFTMYDGTIKNNREGLYATGGDFYLSGGEIINNSTGVHVDGQKFWLDGGRISNNTIGVAINAAAVCVLDGEISGNNGDGISGTGAGYKIELTGGVIKDNGGSGVNVDWAQVLVDGCVITGNRGEFGGGICFRPSYDGDTFEFRSGEISGNTATKSGDDVAFVGNSALAWNMAIEFSLAHPEYEVAFVLNNDWTAASDATYTTSFGTGAGFFNGRIYVPAGANIVLDLNGHTIDRKLSELASGGGISDGQVIYLMGSLEIKDTSANGNGKITGGADDNQGGGVFIDGGNLTLTGGSISGNYSNFHGGGVYVRGNGSFTMDGGTISNNTADNNGGGVYVDINSTFTMNGGTISGNTVNLENGGGVYVGGGTFTMNGGTIADNTASVSGGGVAMNTSATFEMNGGKITGNTAESYAGGIDVYGEFIMNDGEISGNSAATGGGIVVGGAQVFTLNGGTISGNTSQNNGGGGVYVSENATFTMTGGEISDNEALTIVGIGGGIYSKGKFEMTGGKISGNHGQNGGGIGLGETSDTLISGGEISGNVATGYAGAIDVYGKFTMNGGIITGNTAPHGGAICVGTGKTVTMNGGSISGNKAYNEGGGVYIGIQGTLDMHGGTISNNTATDGGGVYVSDNSTFNLYDGLICGNKVADEYSGGGVYVANSSTFNMFGGEISGNFATNGGGVEVNQSAFNLHGGVIKENKATGLTSNKLGGAGVLVFNGGLLNMCGGEISGNVTDNYGGGVYVSADSTIGINQGVITGNSATLNGGGIYMAGTFYLAHGSIVSENESDGYANNVYLVNGKKIEVTGGLIDNGVVTRIGVTMGAPGVFTNNFGTHNSGYAPAMFFFSDDLGYAVSISGNEGTLVATATVPASLTWQYSTDGGNTWRNLTNPYASIYYTGAPVLLRVQGSTDNILFIASSKDDASGAATDRCPADAGEYTFAISSIYSNPGTYSNPTQTIEILPVEIVWQYSFDNATWYNFTGDSYEYAGMVWFVRAYDVVNGVALNLSTEPSADIKATGDYAFAASNGAGNYLNDTFSFKIVQKVLHIEWNFDGALSDGNGYYWIYDSIAHTPVPVIYNAENVQVGNIPLVYKYTTDMNFAVAQATAGNYTLTVSVDDEYITILNGTTSYTIKQKELTVNWIGATDGEYSFDYAPDGYTVNAELVGLIPGEVQNFNIRYTYNNANVETPKAVGVYTATATLVDSVNYFFNDTQAATIRIKTRSLTVEWSGNSEKDGDFLWTFSGNGYAPAAKAFYPAGEEITLTFEYATYVNGRVGSYSSTVPTAAGTYIMRVKLSTAGYNGNEYSFRNNTQVFEIEKLGVTLEWKYDGGELKDGVVRWEYDGQSHNVTPEINGLQIIRDGVLGVNLKVVRTDSASALENVGYATASAALDTSDSFNNNFYITNDTSLDYEVYKRVITSAVWTDKNGNEYGLGASASYNFGTVSGAKGPDFTMVAAGVNGDLSLTVTYSASFDGEWVVDEDNGYVAYAKLSAEDAVNYCFEDESDTAELTFYIRAIGQIKDNVTVTWVIFTSPDEYVQVDDFVAEHGGAYLTYNGKAQSPVALYIKDDGSYIELAISANGKGTDVGEYSVWLLPSSEYNYEGDLECAYEIKPLDVTVEWQNSQSDEGKTFTYVYSGKEQAPYATVNAGGINCSVTVEGKINAGSYTATAVVSENFNIVNGETQNYVIKKLGLDTSLITWSAPDCYDERTADGETYYVYLYDGKSYAPEAKITLDALGITLNLSVQGATSEVGTNYAIAMLDGSNEAHANFSLTGEAIKRFDIVQVSVNTVYWKDADGNVSYGDKVLHFVYNGKAQAPTAYFMNGDTEVKLTVIGERTDAGNAIAYVDTKDFDFGGTTPECEFVIDAKPLGVTWSGTSVTFNGRAQSPVAEAEDVELGVTLEAGVDFTVSAFTNAGKYTAKIVFTNKNYTFADGTNTTEFTIEKIDLSEFAEWSFADGDKGEDGIFFIGYNAEARAPEISVEFTLGDKTVTFTFDYSGKVATVGNHTVTATIASATVDGKDIGAANFTLGNNDGIDYKVTPFEITVDWNYGDAKTDEDGTRFWEYNGSEHAPTASFIDWNGDKIDLKVYGAETNANANAYTASVVAPENCVIADGNDATATFVIKQATIEVVWSGEGATLVDGVYVWTYDGEEHAPVAKIKGTDNELSVTGAATDASDTNYVATAAQSDGNYVIASGETQSFRIKAKTVYVRWYGADDSDDNFEWAYSGYAQGPKAVLCDENNEPILVDGEPVEVEIAGKASTVGTHTALATDTFTNFDFAADAVVHHSFKISPKVLDDFKFAESGAIVTDGDDYKIYTYVYSGDDLQPEPTSGYKETVGFKTTIHVLNSDGSLGAEVLAITDVGSYRITAESLNSNFTLPADKATVDVVVTKYQAEVVWSSDKLTYNGANQAPTAYFVDAKGNEVNLTVTVDGDHADVGTYKATASFTGANGNYELAENVTTEFEIKAYGLAVEWDWTGWTDQTLVYDGEEHLPTATVSAASNLGLKVAYKVYNSDGDLVEGEIKNAGTYKIVLELSGDGKDNYTFDEKEQTFEIKKKALTITIDDVNVDYGDTAPEYSASFDGFVESEADELGDLANSKIGLWLRCDYASGYAPGEYEIGVVTARLAEILKNYEIPEGITGTLTVNEIAFKVIWNSGNSEIPNYSTTTYNGKEYKPNAYYVDEVMGEHYDLEVKYATYDEATGKYTVIDDKDYKAVDAGTYYLVAVSPDGVTLTGTETSFTIEKLAIEVNISSVDNVTFGSVYTADGELVHARLTYKFGAVEPVDNIGLVLTLACADGDFDAYGYLNAGEYKIVASWNEADFGKNYEVTFVGEAEGEDGTNSCGLYKLDKAEIKVNKVKDIYSDEEFEEIISIGDGGNWLYINLNETEADENGVRQYKYIDYAGFASAEEEIVSIKYSTLHNLDDHAAPDPKEDDYYTSNPAIRTAGRYAVNYMIEIANHEVYYGTWYVLVVPDSGLVDVTFNKVFEAFYGDAIPENFVKLLIDEEYISVKGYPVDNFVRFAKVTISDGTTNGTADSSTGVGSYTVNIEIDDDDPQVVRIVRFTENSNIGAYVVKPKVITVDWGNTTFTQDKENPDKVWIDELTINISGFVDAQTVTVENIQVSADGGYAYTEIIVTDNGKEVRLILTATGDFKSVGGNTLLLTIEDGNYEIALESSAVAVTVVGPMEPTVPGGPTVNGGAPDWLWWVLAIVAVALIIMIIVIVVLVKRRKEANGDDDGFYEEATEEDQN